MSNKKIRMTNIKNMHIRVLSKRALALLLTACLVTSGLGISLASTNSPVQATEQINDGGAKLIDTFGDSGLGDVDVESSPADISAPAADDNNLEEELSDNFVTESIVADQQGQTQMAAVPQSEPVQQLSGDASVMAAEQPSAAMQVINISTWFQLQEYMCGANGGTDNIELKLTADINHNNVDVSEHMLNVAPGFIRTLNLNGHKISASGGYYTTSDGREFNCRPVISVYGGSLIIKDESASKSGEITGCNNIGEWSDNYFLSGGGLQVLAGGCVRMDGGTITGNTAHEGGGVFVGVGSTFIMTGGKISNNRALRTVVVAGGSRFDTTRSDAYMASGGGVYVEPDAVFEMHGGEISNNKADSFKGSAGLAYGGGVLARGSFKMHNGTITGNYAMNSGGGVWARAVREITTTPVVTMSGGTISGNKSDERGGGIHIHAGTLTMENGTIMGNNSRYGGSGIDIRGDGTFYLQKGQVQNNYGALGGIYNEGTLHFGQMDKTSDKTSKVQVYDNLSGSEISNVISTKRLYVEGSLTDDSRIGIKSGDVEYNNNNSKGTLSKFTSDEETKVLDVDGVYFKLVDIGANIIRRVSSDGNVAETSTDNDLSAVIGRAGDDDTIQIQKDTTIDSTITIKKNITINSATSKTRQVTRTNISNNKGKMLDLHPGIDLKLANVTFDGGYNQNVDTQVNAPILGVGSNLVGGAYAKLYDGVTLQNNYNASQSTSCATEDTGTPSGPLGGGVCIYPNNTLLMYGGRIQNNTALKGAVHVGGYFKVSGKVFIDNNEDTAVISGNVHYLTNVYLPSKDNCVELLGPLSEDSKIAVCYFSDSDYIAAKGSSEYSITTSDKNKFKADQTNSNDTTVGIKKGVIIKLLNDTNQIQFEFSDEEAALDSKAIKGPLSSMIEQASNGDTITVMKSITDHTVQTVIGKKITIKSDSNSATKLQRNSQNSEMMIVGSGGDVTFENITFEGTIGNGLQSVTPLILIKDGGSVTLGNGAIVQNNDNTSSIGGGGIKVNNSSHLTMQAGSKITGNKADNGGGAYFDRGAIFTMNGGEISGNTAKNTYGGGVHFHIGGDFTMNGGKISGNSSPEGAGVYIYLGKFTMKDGEISRNTATTGSGGVFIESNEASTMENGSISENTSASGAGAVDLRVGTFTMSGGEISNNQSGSDGPSGVMLTSKAKFTMSGGKINNNTCVANNLKGSGVYIEAESEFTMSGGEISENTAPTSGGGVYNSGTFTMGGGMISKNTATNDGGGVYNTGTFTMSNGTISENKAQNNTNESYGGGVYNSSTFTMSGGEISSNLASNSAGVSSKYGYGGGVYNSGTFTMSGGAIKANKVTGNSAGVYAGGIFKLSGNVDISGNKLVTTEQTEQNVYLPNNHTITITGKLDDQASIGITNGSNQLPNSDTSPKQKIAVGEGTYYPTENDAAKFKLDIDVQKICEMIANKDDQSICIQFINNVATLKLNGTTDQSYKTLAEAISVANAVSGEEKVTIEVLKDCNINTNDENGLTITRKNVTITSTSGKLYTITRITPCTGKMLTVDSGGILTLENIILDGSGVKSTGSILYISGVGSKAILNNATTLRNNLFVSPSPDSASYGFGVNIDNSGNLEMNEGSSIIGNSNDSGTGTSGYGGGVAVNYKSTFTMNGGTISSNYATTNGGGVYCGDGTFTMKGGTIINNTSSKGSGGLYLMGSRGSFNMDGGEISSNITNNPNESVAGVYIRDNAGFNMSGGKISGHIGGIAGGGVHVASTAKFAMSGGKITDNKASLGGGVYAAENLSVSSNAEISGNTTTSGARSNVYLQQGKLINANNMGISGDKYIYVTSENPVDGQRTEIVNVQDQIDRGVFKSDRDDYALENYNGKICLKKIATADKFKFTPPTDLNYNGDAKAAELTPTDGVTGMGVVTLKYYKAADDTEIEPIEVGTYKVKIDVVNGSNYVGTTDLTNDEWRFTIVESTASSYTVTYNDNGADRIGEQPPAVQTFNKDSDGVTISGIGTFWKTGFVFKGWNTNPLGKGISYAVGSTYKENANLVLYAVWEKARLEPKASDFIFTPPTDSIYNSNIKVATVTPKSTITGMGTIALNYYDITTGAKVPEAINPGTYRVKINVAESDSYSEAKDITAADWKFTIVNPDVQFYNVTYLPNGATGPVPATQTFTKNDVNGVNISDPDPTLVYAGYKFVGWNTMSDATGETYAGGDKYTDKANLTLYAKWEFIKGTPTADNFQVTLPTASAETVLIYDGKVKTAKVEPKTSGMGDFVVKYYKSISGSTTGEEVTNPKDPGTYIIKINVAEGELYLAAEVTATYWQFTIVPKTLPKASDFTFTAPTNLIYDGTAKVANVKSTITDMGNFTIKYYDATGQTEAIPKNAGTYKVKIDVEESTIYSAANGITAANWQFTIEPKPVPTALDFTFTAPKNLIYDGNLKAAKVTPKSTITDMGIFFIKYYDATDEEEKDPIEVGTYKVKINVAESTTYAAAEVTDSDWQFTIEPKTAPTAEDFTFTPPTNLIYDGNIKAAKVTPKETITDMGIFAIKYYDAIDETEKDPVEAGTYKVKINVAESTTYAAANGITASDWQFIISADPTPKAEDFTFTPPTNLIYDGNLKAATVIPKSTITGMGEVTVKYYDATGEKESIPKDAGIYKVKINVAKGTTYVAANGITADDWKFTISTEPTPKAEDFTFTAPTNLIYDGNLKGATVTPKSTITGMGEVTVKYYDATGEKESIPKDAGIYKVKINVAKGTTYAAAEGVTADDWKFTISNVEIYTVIYDANGATAGTIPEKQTFQKDSDGVKISGKGDLVKGNAVFVSWSTKADGTGTAYSEGDIYKENTNITLYAFWRDEKFEKGSEEDVEPTGTPHWYCYDKSGEKLTGWQEIEIKVEGEKQITQLYYFNPDRNNAAHTGWLETENGDWYYFDVMNDDDATKELESPEEGFAMMRTGWIEDGGNEHYYLEAVEKTFESGRGKLVTGWVNDGGNEWYYYDSEGRIALGWRYLFGFWYYFSCDINEPKKYGQMQHGWQLIGTDWYFLYDDGKMAIDKTTPDGKVVGKDGKMIA